MNLNHYRQQLESLTPEQKRIVGEIIDEAVLVGQEFETVKGARAAFVEWLNFARELKGETKL